MVLFILSLPIGLNYSLKHTYFYSVFTPQPLRAVGVLFSPMVSEWAFRQAGVPAGVHREKVCPGFISETVRCRNFILGRDIG